MIQYDRRHHHTKDPYFLWSGRREWKGGSLVIFFGFWKSIICVCVFLFVCLCGGGRGGRVGVWTVFLLDFGNVFVFLCFCVFVFLCFCVFVFLCFCVFVFLWCVVCGVCVSLCVRGGEGMRRKGKRELDSCVGKLSCSA